MDIPNNQLVLRFEEADLAGAIATTDEVADLLGVTIGIKSDVPDKDTTVCTSRANCYDPVLKAGIHIHEHGVPSPYGNICTMGFHISIQGDEQFVTSGHCGIFNNTYDDWAHSVNFGHVGSERENLIESDARDIMRVNLHDARATNKVYGESKVVFGHTYPFTGAAVKVSLGWGSNTIKTGTISDNWLSWTSNTCGCTVWGADASWTTEPGDSGSPVYSIDGDYLNAIGVNANANGRFARIVDMFIYGAGGGIFVP